MEKYEYKLNSTEVMILIQNLMYAKDYLRGLIKEQTEEEKKNYYEDMLNANKRIISLILVSNRYNGYEDRNNKKTIEDIDI